ncbi:hypothetical protein G7046_g8608 [Stylonectria norvegica]|nr:hypothetical protein G7046_g8608 [Stylonectria norvegica]
MTFFAFHLSPLDRRRLICVVTCIYIIGRQALQEGGAPQLKLPLARALDGTYHAHCPATDDEASGRCTHLIVPTCWSRLPVALTPAGRSRLRQGTSRSRPLVAYEGDRSLISKGHLNLAFGQPECAVAPLLRRYAGRDPGPGQGRQGPGLPAPRGPDKARALTHSPCHRKANLALCHSSFRWSDGCGDDTQKRTRGCTLREQHDCVWLRIVRMAPLAVPGSPWTGGGCAVDLSVEGIYLHGRGKLELELGVFLRTQGALPWQPPSRCVRLVTGERRELEDGDEIHGCVRSMASTFAQTRARNSNNMSMQFQHPFQESQFDIFDWYPKFQSCLRYFVDHAQYSSPVQTVAAFVNIQLPFQKPPPSPRSPARPAPTAGSSSSTSRSAGSATLGTPCPVTLIPYIRRLVVTGFDSPAVLHGFFGDDWIHGIGPIHETERRNYLFAAKSDTWLKVKDHYDMADGQTAPFLRPLQNVTEEEIQGAESNWSEWLAMQDWMLGPRAPSDVGNSNVRIKNEHD